MTGSDSQLGSNSPIIRPSRGTDPVTGRPLPPSQGEREVSEALSRLGGGGNLTYPGNSGTGAFDPAMPGEGTTENGLSPGDQSGDASGNLAGDSSSVDGWNPTVGSLAPPAFVPPPTPPPTRPTTPPTTAGTPITTPTTTTIASRAVAPFRCEVTASVAESNGIRRLVVSIPAANRNVAWANIRWDNSTRNVSLDLSTGSGQISLVVTSDELPDVLVYASPNRLASELGCSFTP